MTFHIRKNKEQGEEKGQGGLWEKSGVAHEKSCRKFQIKPVVCALASKNREQGGHDGQNHVFFFCSCWVFVCLFFMERGRERVF